MYEERIPTLAEIEEEFANIKKNQKNHECGSQNTFVEHQERKDASGSLISMPYLTLRCKICETEGKTSPLAVRSYQYNDLRPRLIR